MLARVTRRSSRLRRLSTSSYTLRYASQAVGIFPPAGSSEYVSEPTEGKFLVPQKTFGRNQLRAQYLAQLMRESPVVLFTTGKSLKVREEVSRKKQLKQVGLHAHRFKGSNLVAAAKYYTVYSAENVAAAERFARGHVTVLLWQDPLLALANEQTMKAIKTELIMTEEEKEKASAEDTRLRLQGAFLMDADKDRPFIWLSSKEFTAMLDNFKDLTQHAMMDPQSLAEMPPHALFQTEINRILVGNMAGITRPLEQQLQRLPQTLEGAVRRVDEVLAQVRDKRQAESGAP